MGLVHVNIQQGFLFMSNQVGRTQKTDNKLKKNVNHLRQSFIDSTKNYYIRI